MDYQKLNKKIIYAWRISRLIWLIAISISLLIVIGILSLFNFFADIKPYIFMAAGLILAYRIGALAFYPFIEYRQWGYLISNDRVEIRHGIFFIATNIIPVVRIQHITIEQGPILRKLGLSEVRIHTASSSFEIEGLTEEEAKCIAESLRAKLLARLGTDTDTGDDVDIGKRG